MAMAAMPPKWQVWFGTWWYIIINYFKLSNIKIVGTRFLEKLAMVRSRLRLRQLVVKKEAQLNMRFPFDTQAGSEVHQVVLRWDLVLSNAAGSTGETSQIPSISSDFRWVHSVISRGILWYFVADVCSARTRTSRFIAWTETFSVECGSRNRRTLDSLGNFNGFIIFHEYGMDQNDQMYFEDFWGINMYQHYSTSICKFFFQLNRRVPGGWPISSPKTANSRVLVVKQLDAVGKHGSNGAKWSNKMNR